MAAITLKKIPVKYRADVERDLKSVAAAIKNKREKLDLTQEELAEKLSVNPISIQFIEQGRRFPCLPMLMFILNALKIELTFK